MMPSFKWFLESGVLDSDIRPLTSDFGLRRRNGQRLHKDKGMAVGTCLPQAGMIWRFWYIRLPRIFQRVRSGD
jgi:hypothetical protein